MSVRKWNCRFESRQRDEFCYRLGLQVAEARRWVKELCRSRCSAKEWSNALLEDVARFACRRAAAICLVEFFWRVSYDEATWRSRPTLTLFKSSSENLKRARFQERAPADGLLGTDMWLTAGDNNVSTGHSRSRILITRGKKTNTLHHARRVHTSHFDFFYNRI